MDTGLDPRRLFLVHWHAEEARRLAAPLRAAGWQVVVTCGDSSLDLPELRRSPPHIVVISLERLPAHGKLLAEIVHDTEWGRHIPIVFLGGTPEELERVAQRMPNARFICFDSLVSELQAAATKKSPAEDSSTRLLT
jgi:DNA-binding response OmpR family regulator